MKHFWSFIKKSYQAKNIPQEKIKLRFFENFMFVDHLVVTIFIVVIPPDIQIQYVT